MTLIPIERFWAPSQKISLLGEVVQILIYQRSSQYLANVGLFVQLKSQHERVLAFLDTFILSLGTLILFYLTARFLSIYSLLLFIN